MPTPSRNIISLDVGERRIGVALANSIARIASPFGVVENDEQVFEKLAELCRQQQCEVFVVGLPRGLNGQETAQTKRVRQFAQQLKRQVSTPLYLQDEAVTSRLAEQELGKRKTTYTKGDIDALAACYILEDWLNAHTEIKDAI